MTSAVLLSSDDDVAVALEDIPSDTQIMIGSDTIRSINRIPKGHKIARRAITPGQLVYKYGSPIGVATREIVAGEAVHVHNLAMTAKSDERHLGGEAVSLPTPEGPRPTFRGYARANGKVGTRNYLVILTSVNCSAGTAKLIADQFDDMSEWPNVDGVIAITHNSGCGMVPNSPGGQLLLRTLQGISDHPNVGALLVLGLGCEMLSCGAVLDRNDLSEDVLVESLLIQSTGGVRATVEVAVAKIQAMLAELDAKSRRTPCDVSSLVLGLNCGGSDGLSGVTANPALGVASDLLVAWGGTSILAETPEIYGAEHLLTRRAESEGIANALYDRLDWWEDYAAAGGGSLDNNPSPGNKAGGLTTILEKSLGAIAKGGKAPLSGFYQYGERVEKSGLVFMDTPGFDPVSVTGIVAGGATVVVFTTGRGSVLGFKPTPVIKVSTNNQLAQAMSDDIDLNAGVIADGSTSIDEVGQQLFDLILRVASGEQTCSEEVGLGADEFVPWQLGMIT